MAWVLALFILFFLIGGGGEGLVGQSLYVCVFVGGYVSTPQPSEPFAYPWIIIQEGVLTFKGTIHTKNGRRKAELRRKVRKEGKGLNAPPKEF